MHRRRLSCILVILLVVNLIGSLISNLPTVPNQDERDGGGEYVLVLDHAWTSDEWGELSLSGIAPLRQIKFEEVLVWKPNDVELPEWVNGVPAGPGEWRADIAPVVGQSLLVVLEPRLPNYAASGVVQDLVDFGLQPSPLPRNTGPSPLPLSVEIIWPVDLNTGVFGEVLDIEGIFWIEPVIGAEGRNMIASAILQGEGLESHPLWEVGLSGQDIVVGIADTGLDRDHACFRNSSQNFVYGTVESNQSLNPSNMHRKLIVVNDSIDDWDYLAHDDGGHGTHTAGTIACYGIGEFLAAENGDWNNATPTSMTAVAYNSRLVVQDLVNSTGWIEPPMDTLLWENAVNGGIIHSNSWGDATTAYTLRSHNLDAWMRENPWSLVFVAAGNSGGLILEPANARSVVAVGASAKVEGTDMYSQSSHGPLDDDRRGIMVVVPGVGIISAQGDGVLDSGNGGSAVKTGTSMSTPMAASTTALIQQMVEKGWVSHSGDNRTITNLMDLRPQWSNSSGAANISLGVGFTPSNNLLRALLSLSAEPLDGGMLAGFEMGYAPDEMQGWGRPNLSRIVDVGGLNYSTGDDGWDPSPDLWIWDGFSGVEDWVGNLTERMGSPQWGGPLAKLSHRPLVTDAFRGPFLSTGEEYSWKLERVLGEGIDARLSWSPKPSPSPVDDLQLVVKFADGRFVVGDNFNQSGFSSIFVEDAFLDSLERKNDSTIGVRIPAEVLGDSKWVEVVVRARNVTVGNISGSVGIDGDHVGFALAVKGVVRDSIDSDGDGVADFVDLCPNVDDIVLSGGVGCSENQVDSDGDGVANIDDECPTTPIGGVVDGAGCWPHSQASLLVISPTSEDYSDILPLDFVLTDVDRNISIISVYLRSPVDGREIMVWEIENDGNGEICSVNLDIWGFWAFFDENRNRTELVVDVVWMVSEKDIDGGDVYNTSYFVEGIGLTFGVIQNEGGAGVASPQESSDVVWPLAALVILVAVYFVATVSARGVRRNIIGVPDIEKPYESDE